MARLDSLQDPAPAPGGCGAAAHPAAVAQLDRPHSIVALRDLDEAPCLAGRRRLAVEEDVTADHFVKRYDALKVQAVVNEANGLTHDGTRRAPTPALFGMNFQVVSVGQKLIEKSIGMTGGYLDNEGRLTPALLGEIQFADAGISKMVDALSARGLLESTLIVISAKHGQSPIDSARYLGISTKPDDPITTSPATILQQLLPLSESPANANGICRHAVDGKNADMAKRQSGPQFIPSLGQDDNQI